MAAEGADADVIDVTCADDGGAIVRFQNAAAVVITHGEDAPFTGVVLRGGAAEAGVGGVNIELAETVHVEDAADGASAHQSERAIFRDGIERAAIETATYVREAEIADQ